MRELQNIMADRELSRAITALHLEVDESIVNNLRGKVDAALRRAKAEVLEELSEVLTYGRFNSYEQRMCERGCGLTKEGKIGASIGLAWALGELDALATLQKGRT